MTTTTLVHLVCFWIGILQMTTRAPVCRATGSGNTFATQRQTTTTTTTTDYRSISFEDLLEDSNTIRYRDDDVDSFSHFVIDGRRQQIIVGARDHVLRLRLHDLAQLEKLAWYPNAFNITTCVAKGQSKEDCHNYIRVLIQHGDELFVCGTNAFHPLCSWRQVDSLSVVESWVSGVAKCPYSPHQNNTFLMTSDRNYYSATVTDFTARDVAIYRTIGPSKYLRTVRFNSHWLNEPDFVSSYEIGDYIYFFFREAAIEYINCGKSIYPRVARICKSDSGGKLLLEDNWTTFLKARLNCSLPGDYPFYFNELQSTFYDETRKLIYAVFTTSPTSVYASAVCVYSVQTIDQVFNGPYKHQPDAQMAWTRVPNSLPNFQCPGGGSSASSSSSVVDGVLRSPPPHPPLHSAPPQPPQRPLLDIQQHQMMDFAVQPIGLDPLVVMETERYTHIALDHANVSLFNSTVVEVPVLFLATLEGVLHKMAILPGARSSPSKVCLVERIHLDLRGSPGLVYSVKLHPEQKVLYISTRKSLFRIPVQRCSRFRTEGQCLAAQDPYCSWNKATARCVAASRHPAKLSSCPSANFPVDGGWSLWSPWLPCSHTGLASHGDQCLCRVRSCDQPAPAFTGRKCDGHSIQVTNCTVNGGWTKWSTWSSCSLTCGQGQRVRERSCSNPSPQHGGRVCNGSATEVDECALPPCPTAPAFLPVDGGWSEWTEWTRCSAICGVGFHTRTRACIRPAPKHGGRICVGNSHEWRTCVMADCDEIQRVSEWSSWKRINGSTRDGGGYHEERFRCACRAVVTDPDDLKSPALKTSMRFCAPDAPDNCDSGSLGIPDVDGSWSSWSSWSVCSALCGSGSQQRERLCNGPSPSGAGRDCHGPSRELRSCNAHSCVAQWSCWSDYSSCSVSCGSGGVRRRHRVCETELNETRHFVTPCEGDSVEVILCERSPCHQGQGVAVTYRGWSVWSEWSSCKWKNLQERERRCRNTDALHCLGAATETRSCPVSDPVLAKSSAPVAPVTNELRSYHIVAASLFSLVAGFVLGFVVFHLFHRRRKRNSSRMKKENKNDCTVEDSTTVDLLHPDTKTIPGTTIVEHSAQVQAQTT